MQALPSVAPVTATPAPALLPVKSTNWMASILSPSVCPPSAATTSPLLRLTTRTPPAAPPTTASVDEGLTPNDVIPSRSNLASFGVNLKTGLDERGSQKINTPSAQAVTILLPGAAVRSQCLYNLAALPCIPSGVNSPHCTAPVWPANTCMVLPDGTTSEIHKKPKMKGEHGMHYIAITRVLNHLIRPAKHSL
jgi:hypothetical protein